MNDKGVTTGEVQAHLAEIYGVQVSREAISTITDRVLDSLAEWQSTWPMPRPRSDASLTGSQMHSSQEIFCGLP